MKVEGIENGLGRQGRVERVAAYIRVSTDEQKLHGLSLDAQVQKIEAYAKANHMKIVEWYKDEGVSGRKLIRKRPELNRMMQDAKKGKFDRILMIKIDRFFRSVAEYHEFMKEITPVVWTTTEEEYDLTTANGRMLVNMKLTIAEMEADQTGERIRLVNDYKASTGQPLVGKQSLPFGWNIGKNEETGRKTVIKDLDEAPILEDAIQHYLTHQSKRGTLTYLHAKHHISMSYNSLCKLLANTMLYGCYRDNPSYCEAYVDKETFDKMQAIGKNNVKENRSENRVYLLTGLLLCPECGNRLSGHIFTCTKPDGRRYYYKKYRCPNHKVNDLCKFNKVASENVLEKMLLKNMELYLEDAKIRSTNTSDSGEEKVKKYNIEEIHAEIDRLNYSWRKGKIRTVEQYETEYDELMELLEKAEFEHSHSEPKDFSKVEETLQGDWKEVYNNLEDEYKRAFWRSFIKSIELTWTTEKKEIARVNFF